MGRKTNYQVFVDKSELNDPDALFDAAISHLIKKGCEPIQRKRFLAQYFKAYSHDEKMAVVREWVQVRDAATYPFRNRTKKEVVEETKEYEVAQTLDEAVEALTPGDATDEDKGVEGGVPVDDGADGEPESGDTSE